MYQVSLNNWFLNDTNKPHGKVLLCHMSLFKTIQNREHGFFQD
jgi:hypothetical protein